MKNGNGASAGLPMMPLCPFRMMMPAPNIIAAADLAHDERRCVTNKCAMWISFADRQTGKTIMEGCAFPMQLMETVQLRGAVMNLQPRTVGEVPIESPPSKV